MPTDVSSRGTNSGTVVRAASYSLWRLKVEASRGGGIDDGGIGRPHPKPATESR